MWGKRTNGFLAMSVKLDTAKAEDRCPHCGHSPPAPSPSGKHLVCPECGRAVVVKRQGPEK